MLWAPTVEQSGEGSWRPPEPQTKHDACQSPRFAEAADNTTLFRPPRVASNSPLPLSDGYLLLPAVLLAQGAKPGEEEEDSTPGRVQRDTSSLSPPPGSAEMAPCTQSAEEEQCGAEPGLSLLVGCTAPCRA